MTSRQPDDSRVGQPRLTDRPRQTAAQKAVLGGGGEEGGRPEPKSPADWAARGAADAGTAGRPPVALGGSSGGQSDRMPTGGGTVSDARATNPKTEPGEPHES